MFKQYFKRLKECRWKHKERENYKVCCFYRIPMHCNLQCFKKLIKVISLLVEKMSFHDSHLSRYIFVCFWQACIASLVLLLGFFLWLHTGTVFLFPTGCPTLWRFARPSHWAVRSVELLTRMNVVVTMTERHWRWRYGTTNTE